MRSSPIKEEIAFHRQVVSLIKREIAQVDRNASRKYIRNFTQEFRRASGFSSYDDLVIACYKADIVYLGDYHALPASQQFAAKLIGEIASRSRQVILAVEMVYGRNQRILDRWMKGGLDDEEFRRRIRYDAEWGYDWQGFREVFETARHHDLRVFGIDCPPRNGLRYIRKRDRYAATRIVDIFLKNPSAKVVVLIGESHLASDHLPAVVRDLLARHNLEKRTVRVLQNLEEIYWQMVEAGQEQCDVVSLTGNTFCAFTASPIEKYESYRQTINRWKAEEADDQIDLTPTIYNMIDTILRFLDIDKYAHCMREEADCIEFLVDYFPEVYSHLDAKALRGLLASNEFSAAEAAEIRRRIARNGSCYIPRINAILIGRFSLVHGGEEAAHFVNIALRGDVFLDEPRAMSRPDLFYACVMEEAVGFFGSKLIDPSRNHFFETDLYQYHRRDPDFIEANTDYTYKQFRSIIDFILLHKKFEKTYESFDDIPAMIRRGIHTRSRRMFSVLTHELGYYLGQQIYDGYRSGRIDRSEIRNLFFRRFDEEGSALKAYLGLIEKLPAAVRGR